MIASAIRQAAVTSTPIWLYADPEYSEDAHCNSMAFAPKFRQFQQDKLANTPEFLPIMSMPRVAECYGRLVCANKLIETIPENKSPCAVEFEHYCFREMSDAEEHKAILYEYIGKGENNPAVVADLNRFFWLAGFGHLSGACTQNYRSGVLVDHSDLVHTRNSEWQGEFWFQPQGGQLL